MKYEDIVNLRELPPVVSAMECKTVCPLGWIHGSGDQAILVNTRDESERFAVCDRYGVRFLGTTTNAKGLEGKVYHNPDDILCIETAKERLWAEVTYSDGQKFKIRAECPKYVPNILMDIKFNKPNRIGTEEMLVKVFPAIRQCVMKNQLDGKMYIARYLFDPNDPTWAVVTSDSSPEVVKILFELERQTRETDDGRLQYFTAQKSHVMDCLTSFADDNKRNPFLDYISRIAYDGEPRLPNFLSSCGGSVESLSPKDQAYYLEAVTKGLFLSVIQRNVSDEYEPIPFMLVLTGEQGSQKSTLVRKLGMDWYASTYTSFADSKKFFESVVGAVMVELVESTQFKNDSSEQIKAFVDAPKFRFRKSYAADSKDEPLKFSLVATTNDERLFTDPSGNRRFFPVYMEGRTATIPPRELSNYWVDQLWAEALELYNSGARWSDMIYDANGQLLDIFYKIQSLATAESQEFDDLQSFLDTMKPNIGDEVSNLEIRNFLAEIGYYNKDLDSASKRIGHHPESFGFKFSKRTTKDVDCRKVTVRIYKRFRPPMDMISEVM